MEGKIGQKGRYRQREKGVKQDRVSERISECVSE